MSELDCKIFQNTLNKRLANLYELIAPENSNGFRPGRGTIDSLFILTQTLRKRKEHGNKESWVLLLDIKKAFDAVPRVYLWETMTKCGVPTKMIRVLKGLYKDMKAVMKVDGIEKELKIPQGTGQGSILGPRLFAFFMLAVLERLDDEMEKAKATSGLLYKMDDTMTGRNKETKGKWVKTYMFGFADDTAIVFKTKQELECCTRQLISIFERLGLGVHTQSPDNPKSKTMAMHIPATGEGDTSRNMHIRITEDRTIPYTNEYIYLGYLLHVSLKDDKAIRARIKAADQLFGSMRKDILGAKATCVEVKKTVFVGMVLVMLLYGSEIGIVNAEMAMELQTCYRRWIRSMSRMRRWHTRKHHISSK
jgi:hypothetical protein